MNTFVWILLILVFVVLMVLFKFKEIRHQIGLVVIAMLLLFLVFSVYSVYSKHKVDLSTFDGAIEAGKIYVTWLGGVGHNIAKVTGYAVHQDWGFNSNNSTSVRK